MMNSTQVKVDRNLAGLQFLMNRPDTNAFQPQSSELDKLVTLPGYHNPVFHVCRAIMRDNLMIICISLRVGVMSFGADGKQYIDRDIHGRGTTFEMALFDLSAQLIMLLGDNDIIDSEDIPIIEERKTDGDKGIRTDESDPVEPAVAASDKNVGKGMETRSNGTGRSRSDEQRHSGSRRQAPDGSRGRKRSKRTR